MTAASIRTNNPGAMWPGPSATKYGSTGSQTLADGNKIATFADPVNGVAAQFDLLNSKYAGMTLADAISKWSGGNSSGAYASEISKATGIPLDAKLTPEMLRDPDVAIPLAKTAARWEAGSDYPISDDQWSKGFALANGDQTAAPATNVASASPPSPTIDSAAASAAPATNPSAPPVSPPASNSSGLLAGLFNSPSADASGNGQTPGGGMLSGIFGGQGPTPQQLAQADAATAAIMPKVAAPTPTPLALRPVDVSHLLAIAQARGNLGTS